MRESQTACPNSLSPSISQLSLPHNSLLYVCISCVRAAAAEERIKDWKGRKVRWKFESWAVMDCLRWVVGMGFWVQGFRCFPWMGVNYWLKDGLGMAASSLQILQNSANLPMVAKPVYGILSDAVPISGQRRLPYLAIGAFLQAISWLGIAVLPVSATSVAVISMFLLLGNLGASIAEVANDAIVAEAGKRTTSKPGSGQLQSFAWMSASSAGALGNLLGGIAVNKCSARTMFLVFAVLLSIQFLMAFVIHESSLDLPKKIDTSSKSSNICKQTSELSAALSRPEISHSIAWFFVSYAIIPLLNGTMFFYQTRHLKLDSSVIGFSKVFGQAALLAWSVVYGKKLKGTSARKVLLALQITISLFMVSDILFVKGFYERLGVPNALYVVTISGLLEALLQFKVLPFSVLMAQLCPPGCEGSVMAFLMSAMALASIISGYLGVAVAAYMGVTGTDFDGFVIALLIQAACALLPLCLSSWIPAIGKPEKKQD